MAARKLALRAMPNPGDLDAGDPVTPAGHRYGLRTSTRLTSLFRQQKGIAMDVTPSEVVDCLVDAKIEQWVLMGLHGYVGYLPMPRATQDVDIMVPYSWRDQATDAIHKRWPDLVVQSLEQVVRFLDDANPDHDGKPQPVIDLMMPWSKFQETILEKYIYQDGSTGHYLPTLEAAIVSKYAPLVSPYRKLDKKELDASDFRRLTKTNYDQIDQAIIRELGDQVWEGGGQEVIEFIAIAIADKPFPV